MTKWADYLIYAVHYEDEPYRKHIAEVKAHKDLGESVGSEMYLFSRSEVIRDIEGSTTFCTIYKDSTGKWQQGKPVIVETIDWVKYIKTERNGIKADNLDNLPTY